MRRQNLRRHEPCRGAIAAPAAGLPLSRNRTVNGSCNAACNNPARRAIQHADPVIPDLLAAAMMTDQEFVGQKSA
jgi:hypothetical protein